MMTWRILCMWVIGVLLWPAGSVFAATYYVQDSPSTAAQNCAEAQNIATPHDTIAEGVACLAPGDTLYLRAGTYTQSINLMSPTVKTGTAGNPITIAGYPGESVIIRYTESVVNGIGGIRARGNIRYIIWDNLKIDGVNYADGVGWQIRDGNGDFTIRNVEIYNQFYNGLYLQSANNVTIDNVYIHDARTDCVKDAPTGHRWQGVYAHDGANLIVRNSKFDRIPAQGIRVDPGPWDGVTIDRNMVINSNYCPENVNAAVVVGTVGGSGGVVQNVTISHNVIAHNGYPYTTFTGGYGGGLKIIRFSYNISNLKIVNNAIVDNVAPDDWTDSTNAGWGMQFISGIPTATEVKNNIIMDNENGALRNVNLTGVTVSNNACTSALFCGTTSKVTLAAVGECLQDAANDDFSQKVGSICIDAGTPAGLAYNGTAPEIGPTEVFVFASCEVPASAPNTIRISFTSNVALLGNDLTTFTARLNTVSNGLVGSPSKIGDTIVSLRVSSSYLPGDTVDISWASGGLTDNMRIGGSLNQPFLQTLTNQSCTNRSGGDGTHVLSVVAYRFHGVSGPEDTTDIRSVENVGSYEVIKGGAFRVRFAVTCTVADCPPTAFYLRYSTDFVNYALVPDIYDAGNIGLCGTHYGGLGVVSGVPTTNQLTTAGTFIPGGVVLYAAAIPTISGLLNGYKTELEYCVSIDDDATDSYGLQLVQQNGGAVVPVVTPVITVVNIMGSAF